MKERAIKKKVGHGIVVGTVALSGLAFACAVRAMPPFKIDVSLWDIAVAWAQGASNPASAAFLKNLDSQGSKIFGSNAWKTDNFVGYVYPATSVGGSKAFTQVFIDKPCGKTAEQGADQSEGNPIGGTGGGVEGGSGGGGNNPSGGSPPGGGQGGGGTGGCSIKVGGVTHQCEIG